LINYIKYEEQRKKSLSNNTFRIKLKERERMEAAQKEADQQLKQPKQ
jgi:hypothetical protein